MADDTSKTHPYTCNACLVAFRSSDAQRQHMRTDWHRYNLKRKIAELPPVSSDEYNDKVITAQASTKAAAESASYSRTCEVCGGRGYFSEGAFVNHLGSQKHKLRVAAQAEGKVSRNGSMSKVSTSTATTSDEPAIKDPEATAEFEKVVRGIKEASLQDTRINTSAVPPRRPSAPPPDADGLPEHPLSPEKLVASTPNAAVATVPLSRCLFCNYDSPNLKLSIVHMTKIHGMFIPEQGYLTDLEGLMAYLQAKVRQNNECLSCHKLKNTTEGIQTHMRDKGHCKIAFETEEEMIEVGQFYDFSSTYSDPGDEDSDSDEEMEESVPKRKSRGALLGSGGMRLNGSKTAEDDGEDGPDGEGWETDSSFSSLDSAEITSVPVDDRSESYNRLPLSRHHSSSNPTMHKSADGFHSHAHTHTNAVFYDDHEMHLPSGRIAGHRSLKNYYRQNLHSYPSIAQRNARAQRLLDHGHDDNFTTDDDDVDEDGDENMDDASGDRRRPQQSRALLRRDEAGMLGVTDAQQRQVIKSEQRSRTKAQRQENRYRARVEKQANSQKHFRDPLLQ